MCADNAWSMMSMATSLEWARFQNKFKTLSAMTPSLSSSAKCLISSKSFSRCFAVAVDQEEWNRSNKWSIWGGVKSLKLSKIILTFLSKSKYNHVQKFEKRDANDQNCIAFLYWFNCLSYNSVGYKKSQHSGKMRIFMGEYNLNLLILQLWVISSNYYKKSIKISVLMCPNN